MRIRQPRGDTPSSELAKAALRNVAWVTDERVPCRPEEPLN